ncbi:MAG: tRNA 2-thiouridine(34) synthase MnmA [Lachnospiraceae bacterium]|nr:tRNA 2-thiouridine(34) synthase MnmA [Lachnospiraceae bacterium]
MPKVVVGMSGGVDSAVAAYLLQKEGAEVIGVTLRVWEADREQSRCCEIDDARSVCDLLGIPYYTFNCLSEFSKHVTEPFTADYLAGKTPNPCILCNRYVKWERMLFEAKVLEADCIATGHYAKVTRLPNGRYTVRRAKHAAKDQTYMLWALTQEQLAGTLMPLSDLSKDEVRKIASDAGIPVADKPDSQEICFVPDGSYGAFVEAHAKSPLQKGFFVNGDGEVLGEHRGIWNYTPGQRKGLGIAFGEPMYVKEIRPSSNEVVLSAEDALFTREVFVERPNFLSVQGLEEGESLPCLAKIRYQHPAQPAVIDCIGQDLLRLTFHEPVRAAAPGQSAVFYDETGCVIGGGFISRAEPG